MGNLFNNQCFRNKQKEDIAEIKSQLQIDSEEAKQILKSFYLKEAKHIDDSEKNLIPLATDLVARAIYMTGPLNIVSRTFEIYSGRGAIVARAWFSQAVDLSSGGAQEWSLFVNG